MRRVLLTGASGFIGRPLATLLAERGYEVHAVGSRAQHDVGPAVEFHREDLLDPGAPGRLMRSVAPTHLVHLAWYTEHGRFWQSRENLPWVEASIRLWREFAGASGERAVMVGSCAEYEWSQPILCERTTPSAPATLYGVCKDAVRRVVVAAAQDEGVSTAWARLFFVYGPGELSGRLVPSIANALLAGRPARSSEGSQVRDFIHVSDAAGALAALLQGDLEGIVNVGSGEGRRVRDVVETIGELAGRPELIELGALPRPEWDPDSVVADLGRLSGELGFHPSISLEDGLADTLESLRRG